jgi:tellurite resistance protein
MGLKQQFEKYNVITDEDIAQGLVYAWTLMVVADERVEGTELKALAEFAGSHKVTRRFDEGVWLENTVGEALNVYNTEGQETLLSIVKEQLKNASVENKRMLLFTLLKLALVDDDFSDRELDLLERMSDLLELNRRDILMLGILNAAP